MKHTKTTLLLIFIILIAVACTNPATTNHSKHPPPLLQSPPSSMHPAMAYDADRQVTVLLVYSDYEGLSETWEYDGYAWTQIETVQAPTATSWATMAYDRKRKVMVLYVARTEESHPVTWEYDGQTWHHIEIDDCCLPHEWSDMVYHPQYEALVLFGGQCNWKVPFGTWKYVDQTWQPIEADVPDVISRMIDVALIYDYQRQRLVLQPPITKTLEFTGTNWFVAVDGVETNVFPKNVWYMPMVYDQRLGVTVLFDDVNQETWAYDGIVWRHMPTELAPSGSGLLFNMVYDEARDVIVWFGGEDAETWEYADQVWRKR